jgi:hypothetical protein
MEQPVEVERFRGKRVGIFIAISSVEQHGMPLNWVEPQGLAKSADAILRLWARRRSLNWKDQPQMGPRTERVGVILSSEEIAAIDEFRFRARIPTRPAAVRELLKRGLDAEKEPPPDAKAHRR